MALMVWYAYGLAKVSQMPNKSRRTGKLRRFGNRHSPDVKPESNLTAGSGVMARLRAYLFAGILVTAPIGITFYLSWLFISFVDNRVTPLIPHSYDPGTYLPFSIPGLGLLVLIIILILIGMFTTGFVGRLFHRTSERMLARMPVVRTIYSAVKQILETVLAKQSNAFRQAVLVEYPRRGMWAVAFITGRTEGEVQNLTEEETTNVFLPTTPNPTSGFLLFIPKKDLIPLSMSVEEAIKMVISGGLVTPPDRRPRYEQLKPKVSAATFEDVDVLREKARAPVLVSKK
jgi:uncharacterized membrane protein